MEKTSKIASIPNANIIRKAGLNIWRGVRKTLPRAESVLNALHHIYASQFREKGTAYTYRQLLGRKRAQLPAVEQI